MKNLLILLFISVLGLSCSNNQGDENIFIGNWSNKSQNISIEKDSDSGIFYITDKKTLKVYKAKYSSLRNCLLIDLEVTNQSISVKNQKLYSPMFGEMEKQ